MAKVAQSGGEVLGEAMRIPGIGRYVSFFDTEGNRASLLEADPRESVTQVR
jgi:predicted enzyme related to lactoylglutathione lyase